MAALDRPFFIDNRLHAFIANADFGTLYQRQVGTDGQEYCVPLGRLQDYIPTIVNHGVASLANLITLFVIYVAHHKLVTPDDRKVWIPNEEMMDYLDLDTIFDSIEDQQRERGPRYNRRGGLVPGFDRNRLGWAQVDQIARLYLIRPETLTPAELVYINDPLLEAALGAEQAFLAGHLGCLREQRDAEQRPFRAERRRQLALARRNAREQQQAGDRTVYTPLIDDGANTTTYTNQEEVNADRNQQWENLHMGYQ